MSVSVWDATKLPEFSSIKLAEVEQGLDAILAANRDKIEALTKRELNEISWANFAAPMETLSDELNQYWSPVSHLNMVQNTPELRDVYNACLPKLTQYFTDLGQNKALYQAYKTLAEQGTDLDTAQKEALRQNIRSFELSGVALEGDKKQRYGEISTRLSELSSKFGENVLDATRAWTKLITDEAELAGLPESALAQAKQMAQAKELDGWLFTLDAPSFMPVMSYADNRELRFEMYQAFSTRASNQGPNANEFDNAPLIDEMLVLKKEKAGILGFDNYAELSVATKMADNGQQVIDFLEDLAIKSKPAAAQDLAELSDYVKNEFAVTELEAWDVGYYSEKLREHKYAISQEVLRPYFPIDKALAGLFKVANSLFDVEIREEAEFDTYHEDVKLFTVSKSGVDVARFYLDPFAREGKRGGAWMDDCRCRYRMEDGRLQLPVAYLVCNFTAPIDGKPSLLTHNELTTLFHEFGHGLHHMLTQVEVLDVSGISGVAWDAVELPSQFMENWCWQEEALAFIACHHETGETLPAELLEKMLAAKNFHAAMQMVRQLEFSLFDFRLHREYQEGTDVQGLLDEVRSNVAVVKAPAFNRFQTAFSHIFAGGYSAGYYSYKWAEVLSADAFSKFEEEGIFNAETGLAFRSTVLENGGSRPAAELFSAFRGREPSIDALLRHNGIAA
ncbi:oligopeptidase A [Marinomonas sp. SBI22]|uniref:oligopeptidase A n=1 Tax=unclassified Marinomonas TaxID=196814 RepID=UPI0007AF8D20|nr:MULTISPECIES: oligopeptidase A [unclassified Marinomonas]KZM40296.1 oligopeptidase A [Marinomonas sp. SBI22]KZM41713.1 oligopeptidase A [Marinomonas sp. SBI8L]